MAYSRTRARDADRAKALTVLAAAFADGQLDRAEHDARVSKLQAARTFADLDAQLFDLQKPGETHWHAPGISSQTKTALARPTLLRGAAAAAIAAIALGVLLPRVFSDDSTRAPSTYGPVAGEAESEPIASPRTPEGYAAFLEAMRAKHQTTEMTRAQVSEESVTVTLPVSPENSRRYVTWSWDGEWSEYSTGKYSDSEEIWLLDLANVDATTFAASLELTLGRIDEPESASMTIASDGTSCYNIYVDNRFDESHYARFTCAGKLVEEG